MRMKKRSQADMLTKLGIEQLNEMQTQAVQAIQDHSNVMILSPTGTGKTLAFLLPIIDKLKPDHAYVQALIIAPSRELALQIEQVARNLGSGYKLHAFYGGRSITKDMDELVQPPSIIIGTPGRIADHLRRQSFDIGDLTAIVLDEFDKSLEVGFEDEMSEIIDHLPKVKNVILTSATKGVELPSFLDFDSPQIIDFVKDGLDKLSLKRIVSPDKDKLGTLAKAIAHLGDQPGIVFCNFKDSISRVSDYLDEQGVSHGHFYGGMEQRDRERALIKFRNGTYKLLLATDLAARGIDVPEIGYIIHYHLPLRAEEFTHRNGRTARMHREGTAYVLHWKNEKLPDFIDIDEVEELEDRPLPPKSQWVTLFVSGGRKDKISKGDIAGFFIKEGGLEKSELGLIELKQDCAFIGVAKSKVSTIIKNLDNQKLKKRKLRIHKI